MNQTTIFDMMYPKYKITKPIRLIELFSGYGSQALALKYLGVPFEHWRTCEWAVKSIQAYKDIHFQGDHIDYCENMNKDDLVEHLYRVGISSNYNEPMSKEQIARLNEKQLKTIFNNIVATSDMVNIQRVTANELDIVDTDKYEYIMTYSFPCQDLSLAGKGKGMSDTSTRSGMLWEVERILTECKELGTMPQVLLMENVPQVHSQDNMPDFHKWQVRLEELGYKSYWQDLIATDYEIPQTRNRCFMISILGDYSYSFPQPKLLKLKLKDMLEDNVDEKYYLSDKMLNYVLDTKDVALRSGRNINESVLNPQISKTISCRGATQQRADVTNFVVDGYDDEISVKEIKDNYLGTYDYAQSDTLRPTMESRTHLDSNVSGALLASGNHNGILIKNATKQGYIEANDGDGIDISSRMEYHRGNVQKDKIQTITTSGGNDRGVVVNMKRQLCNELVEQGQVKENDVIRHSYTTSRMNGEMKDLKQNNISPTLDTRCDCLGVCVNDKPKVLGGVGEKDSNNNTQWKQQNRIYDDNVAISITTSFNPYYACAMRGREGKQQIELSNREIANTLTTVQKDSMVSNNLRIRKLTPRECFRLMGVKDEDFDKVSKNQSDASLYHLAGDSIVVNVLMAIFKELL